MTFVLLFYSFDGIEFDDRQGELLQQMEKRRNSSCDLLLTV